MASGPTIVAKFIADTKNLTSEVDKAAGSATSRLKGFAGKAGLAIGGAFAVGAVVKFGEASVTAAEQDAESQATLARTLQNTTGATEDQIAASERFIASLSKQTAIADDDLRPAFANLVRGFGNAEDAQKALALATDISAGTGKDLGSVSEALMKAANGQTGALGRLGIETKDSTGKAKSLDAIMGDLSDTFGGQAATAADTAAGRMRGAKVQFGEFQEQLGTAVLPLISSFASILTTYVIPALTALASFVSDNISWLGPLAIGVGAVTAAVWLFNAAMAANPIVLVTIALAALVAGIILAYQNCETFRAIVDTAFGAIATAFGWITDAAKATFDWVKDHWPLLLAIITGPIGAAVLIVVRNWDTITDAARGVWDWINNTWHTLTDIIAGPIQTAAGLITTAWDGIKSGATAVYDWVKGKFDAIAGAIEGVVGGITSAIGKVVSAITAPINAVIRAWNGIELRIPTIDIPKVHIPGTSVDLGGGSFGGQSISFPNIPLLASGGVLTSPTLFIGGEAGTEIVAPEEMLRQIVRDEGGGGRYTLNIYPRTADAADVAYGFRRLELMAGIG